MWNDNMYKLYYSIIPSRNGIEKDESNNRDEHGKHKEFKNWDELDTWVSENPVEVLKIKELF